MTEYEWRFEPCSPEDARDLTGTPWPHAVRGRKPQRPVVMGYGSTESAADTEARRKAQQQDAREVLGETINTMSTPSLDDVRRALEEWQKMPHIWIVQ